MQLRAAFFLVAISLSVSAAAQEAVSTSLKTARAERPLEQVVEKQFGPDFKIDTKFQPMYADLDGDGQEDVALIAFSKHPMGGLGAFNYKVIDPYDSYFGLGDPKITTQFSTFGDGTHHCILIIHDWRGETPKDKFAVVNVPFEKLAIGRVTLKKHTYAAIEANESDGLGSLLFFDGHKYRWEPNAFGDEETPPLK
jgi:hypothetical protein